MNCYDIRDELLKGSLDLGIFYEDVGGFDDSITTFPFGKCSLTLVASPETKKLFPDFTTPGQRIPLSFAEFYSVYDGEYEDAWEDYTIYGGLPQVVAFQTERQKAEYLKNIFTNVYLKDVVERNCIQNPDGLNTLVDILASAIGAPTNPTRISNTFTSERRTSYTNKTISKHIDYLEEAFLISKASRYDIKGRKYIGANLKYYFTDLGLRNARLNFRQQEPTHIMENIVYNQLLIRGYNVDTGIIDLYGKNQEGKRVRKQLEVDFVVNQGSQRYYVQVAYDMTAKEKQAQELYSLRNIPDSFKKVQPFRQVSD